MDELEDLGDEFVEVFRFLSPFWNTSAMEFTEKHHYGMRSQEQNTVDKIFQ